MIRSAAICRWRGSRRWEGELLEANRKLLPQFFGKRVSRFGIYDYTDRSG